LLYCKFPGECDSERILKIDQYLTKLCVDNVGLLFLAHPVGLTNHIVIILNATKYCNEILQHMWPESSSVNTVNLAKKIVTEPEMSNLS